MQVLWMLLCVTSVVSVNLHNEELIQVHDGDEFEVTTLYPDPQSSHQHDPSIEGTGSLLCSAFKNSLDDMEGESMELTRLKGELASIVATYTDRRDVEEDVVLEILGILRRLIETLERDYINAVKEKMDEATELPVEAWTDYQLEHTHENVDASNEPTEEPLVTDAHDQQPGVDDSYTTEESTFTTSTEQSPTISQILDGADYGNAQVTSEGRPLRVGSTRGIPGIHFPDYTEIPITSFRCDGKPHIPGFYADMETGCQVFHVCFKHRQESFLCPVGTIFNQPILACDFWYSSNCSMSSHHYDVNDAPTEEYFDMPSPTGEEDLRLVNSVLSTILSIGNQHEQPESEEDIAPQPITVGSEHSSLSQLLNLLPVKARVIVYPETGDKRAKIVATASVGDRRKSQNVNLPLGEKPAISSTVKTSNENFKEVFRRPVEASTVKTTEVPVRVETSTSKLISNLFKATSGASWQATTPKIQLIPPPKPLKRPVKSEVYVPLPKLNPRFIMKPVEMKEDNVAHKPVPISRPKPKRIPLLKTRFSTQLKTNFKHISPLTTKTLATGYVRLLKLRKV